MNGHGQRTYVVSGAASGIGKALSMLLLGEGGPT
jgi:NAD(P)-dependent dehydrogenase (short-subunit alcohol dehydrogenase family)